MGSSGYLAHGRSTSYVNTFFHYRPVSLLLVCTTCFDECKCNCNHNNCHNGLATRTATTTATSIENAYSRDDFDMEYEGCGLGHGYCLGLDRFNTLPGTLYWPKSYPWPPLLSRVVVLCSLFVAFLPLPHATHDFRNLVFDLYVMAHHPGLTPCPTGASRLSEVKSG